MRPVGPVASGADGDDAADGVHQRQRVVALLRRAQPVEFDAQRLGAGQDHVARQRHVVRVRVRRLLHHRLREAQTQAQAAVPQQKGFRSIFPISTVAIGERKNGLKKDHLLRWWMPLLSPVTSSSSATQSSVSNVRVNGSAAMEPGRRNRRHQLFSETPNKAATSVERENSRKIYLKT